MGGVQKFVWNKTNSNDSMIYWKYCGSIVHSMVFVRVIFHRLPKIQPISFPVWCNAWMLPIPPTWPQTMELSEKQLIFISDHDSGIGFISFKHSIQNSQLTIQFVSHRKAKTIKSMHTKIGHFKAAAAS